MSAYLPNKQFKCLTAKHSMKSIELVLSKSIFLNMLPTSCFVNKGEFAPDLAAVSNIFSNSRESMVWEKKAIVHRLLDRVTH